MQIFRVGRGYYLKIYILTIHLSLPQILYRKPYQIKKLKKRQYIYKINTIYHLTCTICLVTYVYFFYNLPKNASVSRPKAQVIQKHK